MAAKRKPGSRLGRAAIDWQHAFQYYAGTPADQRDYRKVAEHFGVSVRTVERHGLKERWRARAAEIDAEAARAAAAELSKERAATIADTERLIKAAYVAFAQQLREGRVRVTPADLPRLHKLLVELWQEPPAELARPAPQPTSEADDDPLTHKLEVLLALRDAGVLDRLQQLIDEATNRPSSEEAA
jgi:hypothetical protein